MPAPARSTPSPSPSRRVSPTCAISRPRASPPAAFAHTEFRLSATADQFLTAASLRALRRVWARVGEACGVPEEVRGAGTHAVTSLRMFSREDPWVNVLRSTLAAFGASVGGAEAITVLPYDTVAGLPERFSRRLARNTQILLCDESNVGRFTDPGGGSWYLESLTDQVAAAVWARFQEVEAAGGVVTALEDGLLHTWVSGATSERALTWRPGTAAHGRLDVPAGRRGAADPPPRRDPGGTGLALQPHRDASAYEALRDRARALGERAAVVVRPLGTQRDSGARPRPWPTSSPPAASPPTELTRRRHRVQPPRLRRARRPGGRRPPRGGRRRRPRRGPGPRARRRRGPRRRRAARRDGRRRRPRHPADPPRDGGSAMSAVPDFTDVDLGDGRAQAAQPPTRSPSSG